MRKQTCVICGKKQHKNGVHKYRISEKSRPQNLIDAAILLKDEIYTRIADLKTVHDVFSADLRYHKDCFNKYLHKYDAKNAYVQFLENIIDQGRGITLTEVRDLIKEKEGVETFTNEIKLFMEETFGERIQFCISERKNQSTVVCSSSITVNDAVNLLRNMNIVKEAASQLRKALLGIYFGIDDKFCDSEELKNSWRTTRMPDDLITFLCELTNTNKSSFLHCYCSTEVIDDKEEDENDQHETENAIARMHFKVSLFHSIFQILYYQVHKGKKNTPLHILNEAEIYDKCKSKEVITSFNRYGGSVSYNSMKGHREALAKYAVHRSEHSGILLHSHFS